MFKYINNEKFLIGLNNVIYFCFKKYSSFVTVILFV